MALRAAPDPDPDPLGDLFPAIPGPWLPSPIHVVEIWEQTRHAEEILQVVRAVEPDSLMTEERFWEILNHPSIIGRTRRSWRLLPAPMNSATRGWYETP